MAEAQFRVTVASDPESPHVVAVGEIDLANVDQFQDVMAKAASGSATLTVDLTEVTIATARRFAPCLPLPRRASSR